MSFLEVPWLELALLIPLGGAVWVGTLRDVDHARKWSLLFSGLALTCVLIDWHMFLSLGEQRPIAHLLRHEVFRLDELNASLLALTALLYLMTAVATPRTKMPRFSFAWTLVSEALVLGTLACQKPWGIIALLALGTLPPLLELRARGKPVRVFAFHMGLSVFMLVAGWALIESEANVPEYTWLALVPLLLGIAIRAGLAPLHCWMTDLFEHASFGTALLFVLPMPAAYAAVRLVLPIAPDWVLRSIGMMALFTAIYAAGMALVQREARRFFCYLFISHSALVFVGMDTIAPIGLTGGLCVWLSVALALSGFGLTLRALEARHGRLSLTGFHGLGEYTPTLSVCFLLTGLASVGFPGTFGFLGSELLVDGAIECYAYIGVAVVLVSALNGIAVLQSYFLLFTGTKNVSSVPLDIGCRERLAVLTIVILIVGGGLYPQPGVASRHQAAEEILEEREKQQVLYADHAGHPVAEARTDKELRP